MVGVDHTGGTDTKVETTDKPPPDRPGTPGQASRAESKAAQAPPEESDDSQPKDLSQETSDTTEPRARDRYLDPNDDPNTVGTPRADSKARAAEQQETTADDDNRSEPRGQDTTERVAEPTEWPEVPPGPRAESRARAREAQQAALAEKEATAEQTDNQDKPPTDREPQVPDDTEAAPSLHETDDSEGTDPATEPDEATAPEGQDTRDDPPLPADNTERPSEIPDGPSDDRGSTSEDRPESPAPEENKPDQFAGLPTRADLDPASAGDLTRERGEPLTPINENQDLTETDEGEDPMKRLLKGARENTDDVTKHVDGLGGTAQDVLKHKPPTGKPSVAREVRDQGNHLRPADGHVDVGSGALGLAVTALVIYQGLRSGVDWMRRMKGTESGGN